MKYIKKFQSHEEEHDVQREQLEALGVYLSYCEDEEDSVLYYMKPAWITTTYNNSEHPEQSLNISRYKSNIIRTEIDGEIVQLIDNTPLILPGGNHTIRYYLRNPYKFVKQQFIYNYYLTSITIPNFMKKIPNQVFDDCWSLRNLVIPNSVSYIGAHVFFRCQALQFIAIYASQVKGYDTKSSYNRSSNVVLDIDEQAFNGLNNTCTIYVYSDMVEIFQDKFPAIANQFEGYLEDWD